jgi:hypothetical protein
MRKSYLLIVFLGMLVAVGAYGQGAPIELWVSTGVSTFRNKTFSQFSENYNAYNANVVDKGLDGFGLGTATNWGVTFAMGDGMDEEKGAVIDFSFFASNQHTKDKISYTDETHRVFDVKRHFFGFEMGAGPRKGRAALIFNWGVLMGNTILNSYYVYPDGTESHGQEKIFTGIFEGFNAAGYVGAKFTYRIGQFKVLAKLSYGGDLFRNAYLDDNNTAKVLNVTQGSWPSELPIDVAGYISSVTNNETYDGERVENKFGSLGIQVGLAYSFLR